VTRHPAPVVVTDLREPLVIVHGRMMRKRLILFGIWLLGWTASGVLWRDGWLATAILLASGPGVWLVVGAVTARRRQGHRIPVSRRALEGPGAAAGR